MPAALFLHNARAGAPGLARAVDQAANAVARQGVTVNVIRDPAMAHLQAAARRAVAEGVDTVFVAGGDGTLGTLAGELAHTPVTFAPLAAGTANVWARAVGLPRPSPLRPRALERAALAALDAPIRFTDLGRANDRWFLSWAGIGLDAYVVTRFEQARNPSHRLGAFWYNVLLTASVARGWRAVDLRLVAHGPAGQHEAQGRFLMATVCNIGLHGGGLVNFTSNWRLDDGLMELWAFRGQGYGAALAHVARVLAGAHTRHPAVIRLTGHRFDLYTAAPHAIHLDGEPQPPVAHLAVEIVPRCLRVPAPPAFAPGHYQAAET